MSYAAPSASFTLRRASTKHISAACSLSLVRSSRAQLRLSSALGHVALDHRAPASVGSQRLHVSQDGLFQKPELIRRQLVGVAIGISFHLRLPSPGTYSLPAVLCSMQRLFLFQNDFPYC